MTVTALPPLRREILVDAEPALAFAVFTEQIGRWWPLGDHSVHGEEATVAFDRPDVGGRIVESKAGADDAVWGTVTSWESGRSIGFTWHPGHSEERASQVTVTFAADAGKTLVTLEHAGWEVFGEQAAEARDDYAHGWPVVLGAYAERAAAA
jgi:uncharacterized protein YndB with AHSA1/START domain